MELRDILLVLHIAGAGTWLGANIVQAVAPDGRQARPGCRCRMVRIAAGLSTRLYMPAAIVILATGIWMVLIEDVYGFGTLRDHRLRHDRRGTLLGIFVFEAQLGAAADAIDAGDQAGAKGSGDGWPVRDPRHPFSCSRSRPWCPSRSRPLAAADPALHPHQPSC